MDGVILVLMVSPSNKRKIKYYLPFQDPEPLRQEQDVVSQYFVPENNT